MPRWTQLRAATHVFAYLKISLLFPVFSHFLSLLCCFSVAAVAKAEEHPVLDAIGWLATGSQAGNWNEASSRFSTIPLATRRSRNYQSKEANLKWDCICPACKQAKDETHTHCINTHTGSHRAEGKPFFRECVCMCCLPVRSYTLDRFVRSYKKCGTALLSKSFKYIRRPAIQKILEPAFWKLLVVEIFHPHFLPLNLSPSLSISGQKGCRCRLRRRSHWALCLSKIENRAQTCHCLPMLSTHIMSFPESVCRFACLKG